MELEKKAKSNRKWAILIGIGLALFPIHNLWFTEATAIGGMATLFVPAIGAVIWILGVLFYIVNNWQDLSLGDKRIYIPLIIIVVSMGLSGFINGEAVAERVSPLLMGIVLFASYVVARNLGIDIFRMLIPFVCLGALIAVILGILNPGVPSGGLITNYCASAAFLIFGTLVNQGSWQWVLIVVALVGVFFIGALEGVFIIGVIGIVLLVRRDYNKYVLISLGVLLVAAVISFRGTNNVLALVDLVTGEVPLSTYTANELTSDRWVVYTEAISRFNFIGHGYSLDLTQGRIVHNVPLMVMDQIGIVAAVAWLGVTAYCAIKTKWHYIWVAILAMSLFDHYLWTQFGPFWWCLIGVSTTSTIKSDLLFRSQNE